MCIKVSSRSFASVILVLLVLSTMGCALDSSSRFGDVQLGSTPSLTLPDLTPREIDPRLIGGEIQFWARVRNVGTRDSGPSMLAW